MAQKAVFVNFEFECRRPGKAYRPKPIVNELNRIWTNLNINTRIALTTKIKAAKTATATAGAHNVVAVAARQEFFKPGLGLYDFQTNHDTAQDEYKYYHALETGNFNAWKALEKVYDDNDDLPQVTQTVIARKREAIQDNLTQIEDTQNAMYNHKDTTMPIPLDPNGDPKIMESYLSDRRKSLVRHRVAREAAETGDYGFIEPNPEHRWAAWNQIGEGGNGQAWVWVCLDKDDKIVNRTVRKDSDYSAQWYDIRWWTGSDITKYSTRIPWEHACHGRMTRTARSRHTVRMNPDWFSGMVNPVTRTHRIYTAWCFCGDLCSIIEDYSQYATQEERVIPEPFIWATAEALALAGLAMARGTEDPTAIPSDKWKPIVHRDLKPQNIFLDGRRSNDSYRGMNYPLPLLGDFGLAFQTRENDPRNPESYLDYGTEGFIAPEMFSYINRDTLTSMSLDPLSEKTNVFGVGVILWSMVTLRNGADEQPQWLGDNPEDNMTFRLEDDDEYPTFEPDGSNAWRYKPELRRLIDWCTKYDPVARPSFADILKIVRAAGDKPQDKPDDDADEEEWDTAEEKWLTKGLKSGWARMKTKQKYALKRKDGTNWGKKDPYRIGLERGVLRNETKRDEALEEKRRKEIAAAADAAVAAVRAEAEGSEEDESEHQDMEDEQEESSEMEGVEEEEEEEEEQELSE